MFYYWLVPLMLAVILAIGVYAYAGKRKAKSHSLNDGPKPEPIRRGRFLNK